MTVGLQNLCLRQISVQSQIYVGHKFCNVSTCTAAVHTFQNAICKVAFCRSLQHVFLSCVHCRCDIVNNHLLQIFRFATVKLKTKMLDIIFLCISNI